MKIGDYKSVDIIDFQIKEHSLLKSKQLTQKRKKLRLGDIKLIKNLFPNAINVLCIGCRDDSEVQDFIDNGFNAIGIDISNNTKLIKNIDAHELNKHFNNIDVVYASHSLEHMYNPNIVMSHIKNITKQGILILLPELTQEPTPKHPSVFEIMRIDKENMNIFKQPFDFKEIWSDFEPLAPFDILHGGFREGVTEREVFVCLKLKEII